MHNTQKVLDAISRLSPPKAEWEPPDSDDKPDTVLVTFEGDRVGTLDMTSPRSAHWARIIDRLFNANQPVYVEIDEETRVITLLLVPELEKVKSMTPDGHGNYRVALRGSPAVRLLLQTDPNFETLRTTLEDAMSDHTPLWVVETRDDHEIIEARPAGAALEAPVPFGGGAPPPGPPPLPTPTVVSEATAQLLFDQMAAEFCDPCSPSSTCITFNFPDNGCQARAHKMSYLMINDHGAEPEKIWYSGALEVPTPNHYSCEVSWNWHVAPVLSVNIGGVTQRRVIDPSLSPGPEDIATWQARQGTTTGTVQYTPWTSYLWPPEFSTEFQTDDDLSRTDAALVAYREQLQDRCNDYGPPPYDCSQDCTFVIDRNTFSEDEVRAMLNQGSPATVESAFYVITDGVPPNELGIYSTSSSFEPTLVLTPSPVGMSAHAVRREFEFPDQLYRTQRITWVYDIRFTNTSGFTAEQVPVSVEATVDAASATGDLFLIRQPNPYEIDGPTSWLSTDLRVFKLEVGQSKFGETLGANASAFITNVIAKLNAGNTGGQTFEDDLPLGLSESPLELSRQVGGVRVYNFAIAKVRYRAESVSATDVRVFFRLFPYAATTLSYDQASTYRRYESGGDMIPLLGLHGDDFTSIPCFAANRIDSATQDMTTQRDPANVQTIPPNAAGDVVVRYFGCWLDINQTTPQFPLHSTAHNGPFPSGRVSIQEMIRHQHQCLVSEIAFSPAPIQSGATPSTSDKLAQRNLSIIESANPGLDASRRINQTFELRPVSSKEAGAEIMFDWGSIPAGSTATVYLPGVDADEILLGASRKYRSHRMVRIDRHTIKFDTGGINYLPLPVLDRRMAGLLTIDLPLGITKGQAFDMVVRQVAGWHGDRVAMTHVAAGGRPRFRRIVGSFQVHIPVRDGAAMLPGEQRLLSNLRWIQQKVPANDVWAPVFDKYVSQIARRVDALGGDAEQVAPSPDGEWKRPDRFCTAMAVLTALLLAALFIVGGTFAVADIAVVALLGVVGYIWLRRCEPSPCRKLIVGAAGAGLGAVGLGVAALAGASATQLVPMLLISATVAVAALIGAVKTCSKP
jgi:hypothetical protein